MFPFNDIILSKMMLGGRGRDNTLGTKGSGLSMNSPAPKWAIIFFQIRGHENVFMKSRGSQK